MDWLRREDSHLSERVWKAVDEAVIGTATHFLAGRRIADFDGPKGWDHAAVRVGTTKGIYPGEAESRAKLFLPDVVLLTEIRAEFSIPWRSIEVFEAGASVLDTTPAEEAAREVALAEDRLVFYGGPDAPGFLTSKGSPEVPLGDWGKPGQAVTDLLTAVETLDGEGIPGPYAVVLDPSHYYTYLRATTEGGSFPAARQLRGVIEAVHRSPVLRGGALFSTRGRDFVLTVGGDLSVGYHLKDHTAVHLFCVESLASQTLNPSAVCLLTSP